MNYTEKLQLSAAILNKAKEFGATLVGITDFEELKKAPSYTVAPQMPEYNSVGAYEGKMPDKKSGEVDWPDTAKSVVVIAYAHPAKQPELDYWYGEISPTGNKRLIAITNKLGKWLAEEYGIKAVNLPYHVEKGGIYLKDAAALAGLGCIGKNNLLLTPEYGSQVRLRAMAVNVDLPPTGPLTFDPCNGCDERCNKRCPQQSFREKIYTAEKFGREELPGRNGDYNRARCDIQMAIDEATAEIQDVEGIAEPVRVIKYCRRCELACPVGRTI